MNTIALLGGSFDPPHIGHEAIVKSLLELEYIEAVVIMPTFLNPFKSQFHAPANLRLRWLKEIFSSYKNVKIDSYEIEQNRPVSSIESVKHLLKTYKKIYLVIGADNLKSLHTWDRYNELKELVTFIVASRQNIVIPENFIKLDIDVDISSTALREHMEISKLSQKCALEINKFYKEYNAK